MKVNIHIQSDMFRYILNNSDAHRIIFNHIIDTLENDKTETIGYDKHKKINRKDIIAKYNIDKTTVYSIIAEFISKNILCKFSNNLYSILEENIIESTTDNLKAFSNIKPNKIIDTSAIYCDKNCTKFKIEYCHYANILKTKFPCVSIRNLISKEVITTSLKEFIDNYEIYKVVDAHSLDVDFEY